MKLGAMEILLAILACVLAVLGIVGAVVPVLPGPLISFVGLLCAAALPAASTSAATLWTSAFVTAVVSLADYLLPGWMARRFGGSRAGAVGATVGAIAGIFLFPPVGILLGPFVGAVAGELLHNRDDAAHALQVGMGSFLAFLLGTGLKLCFTIALAILIAKELILAF